MMMLLYHFDLVARRSLKLRFAPRLMVLANLQVASGTILV